MALVNAYCTVAEVRGQLADDGARLPEPLLEDAINDASRAIDRYCNRRFWQDSAVVERTFEPESRSFVYVDDISTRDDLVVAVGSDGATFPTTLTEGTDFILEPRNAGAVAAGDSADAYAFWKIRLLGGQSFTVGCGPTVSVTARFGWSSVPPEVHRTCMLLAGRYYELKNAPLGVAGFGDFGPVRVVSADADLLARLDGYRIIPVG